MTPPVWFSPACLLSLGGDFGSALGAISGGSTPASLAWPVTNDAIFIPLVVPQAVLIKRLFVINGATASGNVDVGIYSDTGARIVSSGSTGQAGINAPQFFDNTDFLLAPGRYYWGIAMDNVTGTLFRASASVQRLQILGVFKQATAFVLPLAATFATPTATYIPLVGAEIVRVL